MVASLSIEKWENEIGIFRDSGSAIICAISNGEIDDEDKASVSTDLV